MAGKFFFILFFIYNMNNLNTDILSNVFEYTVNDKILIVNKKFNKTYNNFIQKKKNYYFKNWKSLINSRIVIKKKIIKRLINDQKFRNKYLFIHSEPQPHICLKKCPNIFLIIFKNRLDIFEYFQDNVDNHQEVYQDIFKTLSSNTQSFN